MRKYTVPNPSTAASLNNLAGLLRTQGDLAGAQPLRERALAIREKVLGPEHRLTVWTLNGLARVFQDSGDLPAARTLFERALTIYKKTLAHPSTNIGRYLFAGLLLAEGNAVEALRESEAALPGLEKAFGKKNQWTKDAARITTDALDAVGRAEEAAALRARYGVELGQIYSRAP